MGDARIVLTPDRLPQFFLGAGSPALEAQVAAVGWETLYELSWRELAAAVTAAAPKSEIFVLSARGTATRCQDVTSLVFGDHDHGDRLDLLRHAITETGRAVLARLVETGMPDAATRTKIYTSFASVFDPCEIAERLGIDKTTNALLEQRFQEDLMAIRGLPGVEVI